jgi:hypothetical protein
MYRVAVNSLDMEEKLEESNGGVVIVSQAHPLPSHDFSQTRP